MAVQSGTMESSFANDNIRAERERMNELIRQKMLAELPAASARLADRGIDPRPIIGTDYEGKSMSVAQFYLMLRAYSVTEKAGQDPTYKAARVAIASDLAPRARDAAFVALNQQSAEEAGHGDKVFGAAYYEMGGVAPALLAEDQLNNGGAFLEPVDDPRSTRRRCWTLWLSWAAWKRSPSSAPFRWCWKPAHDGTIRLRLSLSTR